MKKLIGFFITGFAMLHLVTGCIDARDQKNLPFNQKELTIVVTDSGLGGLAVMDTLAKKMKASGYYEHIDFIFVNALFNADFGYNALESREEKIDTFNMVLKGIEKKFHPDVILIGCNTLSVLYRETDFVKESDTPVMGIIEPGVRLIIDNLSESDGSSVIITGTETTISEDSHRKALLQKGISEDRIITQACPELQSYIENDPDGEDTEMLISFYISEAIDKLPENPGTVYLSLNCSHFGYSEKLWEKAFREAGVRLTKILNPNDLMGKDLVPETKKDGFINTKITQSVYSRVPLKNQESITGIFKEKSPGIADALSNYTLARDLF